MIFLAFRGVFLLAAVAILAIGLLFFVAALVERNKRRMALTALAPLLLAAWLFAAARTPNAESEFERLFGNKHRAAASEVQTVKPLLMDGYFISFRMKAEDFTNRIRPGLRSSGFDAEEFLLGQKLPKGWPEEILAKQGGYNKDVNGAWLNVIYLREKEQVYASLAYESW